MAAEGSKAKHLRDLFDRAIDLRVPKLSVEEFDRVFGVRLTEAEIAELTFGELMVRQTVWKAAAGNDRSITEVLDRLLGKPVQTTESTVKSYSYHDFLIQCRDADAMEDLGLPPETALRAARSLPAPAAEVAAEAPIPAESEPYDPAADLL